MTDDEKLWDCTKRLADAMRKEAALKMCVSQIGWAIRGVNEHWEVDDIAKYAREIYETLYGSRYE